jgi:bifunctional UDP-N-acetylglucosamine pyrophosphorylase/glucosamine-1-phosphate N-acetyltransferase
MTLHILILAAGKGTRMNSNLPKLMQPLAGIPLLEHVIKTAEELKPKKIHVVYGNGKEEVESKLSHLNVNWIYQAEQLGTGHAVLQALPFIEDEADVLILFCDVPLLTLTTLQQFLQVLQTNSIGILTTDLLEPRHYGRIIRDNSGDVVGIVEYKDATQEEKEIKEVNSGIFAAKAKVLKKYLQYIKANNAQKEYYLTDIVKLAVTDGLQVSAVKTLNNEEILGINDKIELANAERIYQRNLARDLMLRGLTLIDPNRFDVRGNLTFGKDVTIDVNVIVEGDVKLGDNVIIEQNVYLKNVEIYNNVRIRANSIVEGAIIEDNCIVGPFARIHSKSVLHTAACIGNFVEVKNAEIGNRSKAKHLTYLGDALIGDDVNVGAGVIICNYDGANKYQTVIEDGAFIGSDSQLVAPVKIGKNSYIGTGSTITHDTPENKLTVARARQVVVEHWQPPKKGVRKK